MKIFIAAALLLLASETISAQICQAPTLESVFCLTSARSDFYVAKDFEQGNILIVFNDNAAGDHWTIVDLVSGFTYLNTPKGGCKYTRYTPEQNEIFEQYLPRDAVLDRSGDVDFYYTERPGFTWLVGMQPVPDTEYYFRHFSRFFHKDVVAADSTFGMVYQYSLGISDPTVFDFLDHKAR